MSLVKRESIIKQAYSVASVEKTDSPDESTKGNWYKYVIQRGEATIVGSKRGTLKQVTSHAESVVDDLNSRSGPKSGSVWSAQNKK